MMDIDGLRRKAAAGNCAAQSVLGALYLDGIDTEVNYAEAFRFLSAAANQGASRAIANLARMFAEGLGTTTDLNRAVELYERVGKVEFAAAIALGRIYSLGVDRQPDPVNALKWYSVAASFEGIVRDCDDLNEAKAYLQNASRRI